MMLDATTRYAQPLTADRLFDWHAALFATGRSGMQKIAVGKWREGSGGPMQVLSGPIGRQQVHYEAPPAPRVPEEMNRCLRWFESPGRCRPAVRCWARICGSSPSIHLMTAMAASRAIADMALARSERSGQRFYSLSGQIRRERADYYTMLGRTQKGTLDVTRWQEWFLSCLQSTSAYQRRPQAFRQTANAKASAADRSTSMR